MKIIQQQNIGRFIFLSLFPLFYSCVLSAQQKNMEYNIINKNDTIGKMQITEKISGDDLFFTLSSSVQTKLLMTIKVDVREASHYYKDKLLLSLATRVMNDKPKGNKETRAEGDIYLLKDDDKESRLNQKVITYNFAKLYFREPTTIKEVYSDYYQKNLSIVSLGNHTYKIDIPEGGSNVYSYKEGICVKVDMHNTLFNAQMVLNQ